MKSKKLGAVGVAVVLLVSLGALGGQRRREEDGLRRRDAVKRAMRAQQAKPGFHTLSFQGPARMLQSEHGVFFSPGATPLPLMMGFPIEWTADTWLTSLSGEPLSEISGNMSIRYVSEDGLLNVSVADDAGQELRTVYRHKGFERVDPVELAAFVDEFFQYMNTDVEVLGSVSAELCTASCSFEGGGCSCSVTACAQSCSSCQCTCDALHRCQCQCFQSGPPK